MNARFARLAPVALLLLLTALIGSAAAENVAFRFDPDGSPKAVYLAGDFGWPSWIVFAVPNVIGAAAVGFVLRAPDAAWRQRLIDRLGLKPHLHKVMIKLSGGMKRRFRTWPGPWRSWRRSCRPR